RRTRPAPIRQPAPPPGAPRPANVVVVWGRASHPPRNGRASISGTPIGGAGIGGTATRGVPDETRVDRHASNTAVGQVTHRSGDQRTMIRLGHRAGRAFCGTAARPRT